MASGFPVLLIAYFGNTIQDMHPDTVSISDFVRKRFGPVFSTYTVCLCLFNMSIAMLAECVPIVVCCHARSVRTHRAWHGREPAT